MILFALQIIVAFSKVLDKINNVKWVESVDLITIKHIIVIIKSL
jgi:hypothetical protein